jgi:hypothetical protein
MEAFDNLDLFDFLDANLKIASAKRHGGHPEVCNGLPFNNRNHVYAYELYVIDYLS